jgi:hypothetical protein
MNAMFLLAAVAPQPPIIRVAPAHSEIVSGSFSQVGKAEQAALACGLKQVGFAVPDGPEHTTYLTVPQSSLSREAVACLRRWIAANPSSRLDWKLPH